MGTSQHLKCFNTLTTDWTGVEFTQNALEISFAYFSAANVNYRPFDEHLEDFSPHFQIFCIFKSIIIIYYGQYGKFVKSPEDKHIVDVFEIVGDLGKDDILGKEDNSKDDNNEVVNNNSEDKGD